MLRVIKPGLQSTLQGAPRLGFRYLGVPHAGPADPLSMALANRLVGNARDETCLEITYGGFEGQVDAACTIALTGACGAISVSGRTAGAHTSLHLREGDTIAIAPPEMGARAYLAIHSGFHAETAFASASTYLPAGFGGFKGRALRSGDVLRSNAGAQTRLTLSTPEHLRPVFSRAFAVRACPSAEAHLLSDADLDCLFCEGFTAGRQATRMGIALTGSSVSTRSDGQMKSAPVFPGTVQCPPSGTPVVLLCDAQTTGGYPRIANIARCDRHLLGQIRPGDQLQLLKRTPEAARKEYAEKQELVNAWLAPTA
ncbi:MAG: biotin-dependent carboxyltransferase family protein [Pseudomonadota bacterium]|jgi:allophanate hydrolase|nr:biotin-dependent carboxyltransferase family protein [Pseudomonadota bacterium]